jgi:hypothetical protein
MATGTLDRPMTKRNDVTVKVDADVIAEAKMVAASRDQTLAEYLSETLRPIVRKDLEGEYARRSQGPKPAKGGGGKAGER